MKPVSHRLNIFFLNDGKKRRKKKEKKKVKKKTEKCLTRWVEDLLVFGWCENEERLKLAVFRSRYTGVFVFPLWGWERKLLSLLMWSQLLTCAAENYRFCFSVGLWSTFEKCISQKMNCFTSGVNMSADCWVGYFEESTWCVRKYKVFCWILARAVGTR